MPEPVLNEVTERKLLEPAKRATGIIDSIEPLVHQARSGRSWYVKMTAVFDDQRHIVFVAGYPMGLSMLVEARAFFEGKPALFQIRVQEHPLESGQFFNQIDYIKLVETPQHA